MKFSIDYLRDPDAIYRQSCAIIQAEADFSGVPRELKAVALRLAHACGKTEIISDLTCSVGAVAAGNIALAAGAAILVDVEMTAYGIIKKHLFGNPVICTLNDPRTPTLAQKLTTTRTAAALDLWGEKLDSAVVAIGNSPTALFRLLELLAKGAPRPALIIGMPVGFVGASESKEALITYANGVPYMTLKGRFGGSALAAAALNALVKSINS